MTARLSPDEPRIGPAMHGWLPAFAALAPGGGVAVVAVRGGGVRLRGQESIQSRDDAESAQTAPGTVATGLGPRHPKVRFIGHEEAAPAAADLGCLAAFTAAFRRRSVGC